MKARIAPKNHVSWLVPIGLALTANALHAEGDVVVHREVPSRIATRSAEPGPVVAVEASPRSRVVQSLDISTTRSNSISRELGDKDFAMLVAEHRQAMDPTKQAGSPLAKTGLLDASSLRSRPDGGSGRSNERDRVSADVGRAVTGAVLRFIILMNAAKQ